MACCIGPMIFLVFSRSGQHDPRVYPQLHGPIWSDPSLALEMVEIAKLDAPKSLELTTTILMVDLEQILLSHRVVPSGSKGIGRGLARTDEISRGPEPRKIREEFIKAYRGFHQTLGRSISES